MSYLDRVIDNLLSGIQDMPSSKHSFRSMIDTLLQLNIIDSHQKDVLSEWRMIRNKAMHELTYPTRERAADIIPSVEKFVAYLRSIEKSAHAWWMDLNDYDRKVLTEKFLVTLHNQITPAKEQIASKLIFGAMGLGAYSDIIVPMIVKTLETNGYITIFDDDKVQLTKRGTQEAQRLESKG